MNIYSTYVFFLIYSNSYSQYSLYSSHILQPDVFLSDCNVFFNIMSQFSRVISQPKRNNTKITFLVLQQSTILRIFANFKYKIFQIYIFIYLYLLNELLIKQRLDPQFYYIRMGCAESGATIVGPKAGASVKMTPDPRAKQAAAENNPETQLQDKSVKPVNIIEYMDDFQETSELQQDLEHGVDQQHTVKAKIDWENKTVEFIDDYKYTFENNRYVEVTRRTRTTKLSGVFKEQGGKLVANVKGSYSQYNKQNSNETLNVKKSNVSGSFVIEKTIKGIRIKNIVLLDQGVAFQTYSKKPVAMKKI